MEKSELNLTVSKEQEAPSNSIEKKSIFKCHCYYKMIKLKTDL